MLCLVKFNEAYERNVPGMRNLGHFRPFLFPFVHFHAYVLFSHFIVKGTERGTQRRNKERMECLRDPGAKVPCLREMPITSKEDSPSITRNSNLIDITPTLPFIPWLVASFPWFLVPCPLNPHRPFLPFSFALIQ